MSCCKWQIGAAPRAFVETLDRERELQSSALGERVRKRIRREGDRSVFIATSRNFDMQAGRLQQRALEGAQV